MRGSGDGDTRVVNAVAQVCCCGSDDSDARVINAVAQCEVVQMTSDARVINECEAGEAGAVAVLQIGWCLCTGWCSTVIGSQARRDSV